MTNFVFDTTPAEGLFPRHSLGQKGICKYNWLYGGSIVAALTAMFNPSLLTLSDTHGNVAEAISITGRTMTQYNGVLVPLGATEHHLQRGRRVENRLSYPNDFSNAAWSKGVVTLTGGQPDPDGGSEAWAVDIATAGVFLQQTGKSIAGSDIANSVWLKRKTGTGDIGLYNNSGTYVILPVTSAWQRFFVSGSNADTFTFLLRAYTAGDAVYVYKAMHADVTGMPADYVPEYVAKDTAVGAVLNADADILNAAWTPSNAAVASVISGVIAKHTAGAGSYVDNDVSFNVTAGESYVETVTVDSISGGGIQSVVGGTWTPTISTVGTHTRTITATTSGTYNRIWLNTNTLCQLSHYSLYNATTGIQVFDATSGNTVLNNIVTPPDSKTINAGRDSLINNNGWIITDGGIL